MFEFLAAVVLALALSAPGDPPPPGGGDIFGDPPPPGGGDVIVPPYVVTYQTASNKEPIVV